ncbi:hypothetical protein ACW2Q0_14465 [Nocardia sp. R16R-3T]
MTSDGREPVDLAALVAEYRRLELIEQVAQDMHAAANSVATSESASPEEVRRAEHRHWMGSITALSVRKDLDTVVDQIVQARDGRSENRPRRGIERSR